MNFFNAFGARTRPVNAWQAAGWRAVSLLLVLVVAGCAAPPRSSLERFPPLANDKPPGASVRALRTAAALGRGVNLGNMLDAPREGDWGLSAETYVINAVVEAGFTTVRLPVRWSNHAGVQAPFAIEPAFAARVERVVDALLDRGLYVVLNMHHNRPLDGDPRDDGDVAQQPALVDERFLSLWRQIGQRFSGKGERLLFDLYNEPHGRLDAARWNDLVARGVRVVRERNPERVVVLGTVRWNSASALAELRLPNDANLMVSVHNYAPFSFTHQGAPWIKPQLPVGLGCCDASQRSELVAPLELARAWSQQSGYPVYIGEFGAFNQAALAERVRYTRLMRNEAEARGFSWAYWEFAAGFGVYDPANRRFVPELLQALTGEEPASAPVATSTGTPTSSSVSTPVSTSAQR